MTSHEYWKFLVFVPSQEIGEHPVFVTVFIVFHIVSLGIVTYHIN